MGLRFSFAASVVVGVLALASEAKAAGLNDWSCKPAPGKFPVVLAHGRGGTFDSMPAVADALTKGGWCVFALNYGQMNGKGSFGMAHLDQSGGEFAAFTNKVLQATGAQQIDAIGYSEGGMVIDNYILVKGGANKVHRYVGIAGAHYPYASYGVGIGGAGLLYCPTFISQVQKSFPPFTSNLTSKDIMKMAVALAPGAFNNGDAEVVQSDFVVDLFDEQYWRRTHGKLSEGTSTAVQAKVGSRYRSFNTPGATAPNICYHNITVIADGFVGPSTAFGDKNYNVVNVPLVTTTVGHGDVPKDSQVIAAMMAAMVTPILPGNPVNCGGSAPEPDDADDANGSGENSGGSNGGTTSGDPSSPGDGTGTGNGDDGSGTGTGTGNGNDGTGNGSGTGNGTDGTGSNGNNDDGSGSYADDEPGSESSGCNVASAPSPASIGGFAGLGLVGLALLRRRRTNA